MDINLIDEINRIFGVENEVSAPILISIIIFVIGGLVGAIFKGFINYSNRRQTRKYFQSIIKEIAARCQKNSKSLKRFYPTLHENYDDDWHLRYSPITYLGLAYQQDLQILFSAYSKLFIWRMCSKEKSLKAYNRIWSMLEGLKFFDSRITDEFNEFIQRYNKHEERYKDHIEELRRNLSVVYLDAQAKKFPIADVRVYEFIKKLDEIWYKWQVMENNTRMRITYHNLIIPAHKLYQEFQDVRLATDINNLLLPIMYEYAQIQKIISFNQMKFRAYFYMYFQASKLLTFYSEVINCDCAKWFRRNTLNHKR
ncbi:MAG: hypothetical protein POELPBGB_01318 [Bacteroidia bacterium]|nr:hypothetical protein [Bacteroidia bacterium]